MTYDKLVTDAQRTVRRIYRDAKGGISEAVDKCLDECLPDDLDGTEAEEKNKLLIALKYGLLLAIARLLYNANKEANNAINGYVGDAFTETMNQESYDIETELGLDIGLFPVDDIAEWIEDDPEMFGVSDLNRRKDERWNMRNIRSVIIGGVLAGIARKRLTNYVTDNVISRNQNSMLERAYNIISGSGEFGRDSALCNAENNGVRVQKEWIATLDFKTRDAHRELDGQRVSPNEPFTVDGEEIMYPRDPAAKAYLRCNCRCAMRRIMSDWQRTGQRKENVRHYNPDGTWTKPLVPNMTYQEWYQMKVEELGEDEIQRQVKEMKREQQRKYRQRKKRNE